MKASQKVLFLKKPSHWRPLFVLMIDGLPDGTSSNRLKDLIRSVDESFTYLNVLLANGTEGKSLGFAFVRFQTATLAKLALSKASFFVLDGKPLVCRWMGENRDVAVGEKSAEGSIEASTPQSQIPVEESDSERMNVDVEVEATDEVDENAGAQPTPVKTLTMAHRRRIKRKSEGLKKCAETMTNRDRAEALFGLMGGLSEAQLSSCIGTLPYRTRAKFLRLDGLPAWTSREEPERPLNGNYKRRKMCIINGRGTTIVFVRKQVAREASKRLRPTFTLRGATVTCTWFGAGPQEETTRDKDLEIGTIEDAQDSVEKSVEEAVEENTQAHIEDAQGSVEKSDEETT